MMRHLTANKVHAGLIPVGGSSPSSLMEEHIPRKYKTPDRYRAGARRKDKMMEKITLTEKDREALVVGAARLVASFIAPLYIRGASKILNSKSSAFPRFSYLESLILIGAVRTLTTRPRADTPPVAPVKQKNPFDYLDNLAKEFQKNNRV